MILNEFGGGNGSEFTWHYEAFYVTVAVYDDVFVDDDVNSCFNTILMLLVINYHIIACLFVMAYIDMLQIQLTCRCQCHGFHREIL